MTGPTLDPANFLAAMALAGRSCSDENQRRISCRRGPAATEFEDSHLSSDQRVRRTVKPLQVDRTDLLSFGFEGDKAPPTKVLVELEPHAASGSEKRTTASRATDAPRSARGAERVSEMASQSASVLDVASPRRSDRAVAASFQRRLSEMDESGTNRTADQRERRARRSPN